MTEPITDPSILEGYLTDASNVRGHAEALLRPGTAEEVSEIVRHCQAHGIPLTVTAARTSTTAAPVPFGGWLLSTERLCAVEHIGHDHAVAGAGANLGQLQDQIEATGRFFPPDPTSRYDCTLGAAIACNASGARSFRYGPTRPWVSALDVVLPTGELRRFQRGDPLPHGLHAPSWLEPHVKTAAGYAPPRDALDLFIGQEGTLGVITRAEIRLTDLPRDVLGMILFFRTRPDAVRFVEAVRRSAREDARGPVSPRCVEYFDHACLEIARQRGVEVPDAATAALFCEQELWDLDEDAHLSAWWEALEQADALADATILASDPAGRARLHALRHAIPAGINERVVRNGMPKVGTDLSVPDAALTPMMEAYEAAPFEHVLFGHIGDNHLHLNLLPRSAEELAAAKRYYDDLARLAISLGGSISAEHGVGKLKVHQLSWMVGEATLKGFVELKRSMDPRWILGRGTLLAAPEP
jgi:D-lactate dehydrogenase (cytochrome)